MLLFHPLAVVPQITAVSLLGQTAKNSPQALTSELPPTTDMVTAERKRPSPFRVPPSPCELLLVLQITLGFLEKIRGWADRDRARWTQRRCYCVSKAVEVSDEPTNPARPKE